MAIYTGVLEKMSGGDTITSNPRWRLAWGGWWQQGPRDVQEGWARRQFIDVGDHHLRNVALTQYHDEVLSEAVGEEVVIGAHGGRMGTSRTTVVGIRTPKRGLDKPSIVKLVVGTVVNIFAMLLAAAVLILAIVLTTMLVGAIFDSSVIGLLAASPFITGFLVVVFGNVFSIVMTWLTWWTLW